MVFNALLYKRRIQEANRGVEVRYALSSNGRVIVDDAEAGDVTPLATVRDAQDLAEKIAEWSGGKERGTGSRFCFKRFKVFLFPLKKNPRRKEKRKKAPQCFCAYFFPPGRGGFPIPRIQ